MATAKQTKAARQNVTKAQEGAKSKKTIAHMPKKTRTALGQQGAAVARRKRTGGDSPKTRAELYEIAKQRDLPGRRPPRGLTAARSGARASVEPMNDTPVAATELVTRTARR